MALTFNAVALASEINLNHIANHFGIHRKIKWEESLSLGEGTLTGVLREPAGKAIYIFPFGSMVFINCEYHEMMDALRYLAQVSRFDYTDAYEIRISPLDQPAINNDYLVAPAEEVFQKEIVATVLAKSVALEKIERDIDLLVDEFEEVVASLRQGRLGISDRQTGKMAAKILGFRLSTVSYIMLLDKPDITWVNGDAEELYNELSSLFELGDRHDNVKYKTDMLMDINEAFASLAHARRGTLLEWAVIILISIEIVLGLITTFWK